MPNMVKIVDLRQLACAANGGHQWTGAKIGPTFSNWPICKRCLVSKREVAKQEFVDAWNEQRAK